MKFVLRTGTSIDLPDREAVSEAIKDFEAELKRLRRLLKVIDDLKAGDDDDEEDEAGATPKANGTPATPTPTAEAPK